MEKNISKRIIYEDSACIVVNKIKGEALEKKDDKNKANLLTEILKLQLGHEKLFITHRLDVPTSGLVLLAKTSEGLSFYNRLFAQGKIEKKYWAIVEKNESFENLISSSQKKEENEFTELFHHLWVDGRINKSFASKIKKKDTKEARLLWRLCGIGDNYGFLEIDLLTGRHHQIRAQLAAENIYIKGDLKYGAKRSEKTGGIRLHAASLSFPNFFDPNKKIEVLAPPSFIDPLWQAFIDSYKSTKNNNK